jgi:hypothetical protein
MVVWGAVRTSRAWEIASDGCDLVQAVTDAGDLDRAEAITAPDQQARSLADPAIKVGPKNDRSLIAAALAAGHWQASINALAKINPAAVIAIADEYLNVADSIGLNGFIEGSIKPSSLAYASHHADSISRLRCPLIGIGISCGVA